MAIKSSFSQYAHGIPEDCPLVQVKSAGFWGMRVLSGEIVRYEIERDNRSGKFHRSCVPIGEFRGVAAQPCRGYRSARSLAVLPEGASAPPTS